MAQRCRVRVYLGPSTSHASSAHLILSLTKGFVSLQFHFWFDELFDSVGTGLQAKMIKSEWQSKAGLCEQETRKQVVTFMEELTGMHKGCKKLTPLEPSHRNNINSSMSYSEEPTTIETTDEDAAFTAYK